MALRSCSGQNYCSFPNRGGVAVYYARQGVGIETLRFVLNVFTFQLTTYIYFLKEDYYVQKIDLFNFFCFDAKYNG